MFIVCETASLAKYRQSSYISDVLHQVWDTVYGRINALGAEAENESLSWSGLI